METAASEEFGTEAQTDKYDLFGSKGVMKRSDFGMRVSATAEWQQFVFSLGYEFGFVNVAKSVEFDSDLRVKISAEAIGLNEDGQFLYLGWL